MRWTVDQALEHWQREELITAAKARELHESLDEAAHELPSRAIRIFSVVGAFLIGLGVILFVASNWQDLTPAMKTGLLLVGMLATGGIGYWMTYERANYPRTGLALLVVSSLIYGASIFLVGQIYHLPLNFWWGMALWWAGVTFLAYVLTSKVHLVLAVPLLVLAIGWLRAEATVGFSELGSILEPSADLDSLLPILGVGMLSGAILHRRVPALAFGETILFHWGFLLLLIPLLVATADRSLFFQMFHFQWDFVGSAIAILAVLSLLTALVFGTFTTPQGRWALLALVLFLLFTFILVRIPEWMGVPEAALQSWNFEDGESIFLLSALHALYTILVFVLLLTIVWEGTLLRMAGMINIGIIGLGIAILIQYFSWAFEMLDRSVAFIVGGLLILVLSALLERKRRDLLLSVRHA